MTAAETALGPPRLVEGGALRIAGLRGRFTPATIRDIPVLWEQWLPNAGRVPGRLGREDFGVCLGVAEEGAFDYVCGVRVGGFDGLPEAWARVEIPAQRCAVFDHPGHVSELSRTVGAIFREWLPNSGHGFRAAPGSVLVFERYTERFDPKRGVGGVEVWLPIDPSEQGQAGT